MKFAGIGKENTVMVNVDEIRPMLPEFKPSADKPVSTEFTHEEASDIAKELTKRAVKKSYNLVLDGTGDTTLEKLGGKVAVMRSKGHKIIAEYVTCPVEDAQARADARGKKIGRFVPPTAMKEAHKAVSQIFPEAIRQGLFDEARLYDTRGAAGVAPKLVASSRRRTLVVHNQKLWDDFIKKGNE